MVAEKRAERQTKRTGERVPCTKLRVFVLAFAGAMFLASIGVTVWHGANGFEAAGLPLLLSNVVLWLIPFACHIWFRRAVSDGVLLIAEIFLFFASFLGSCVRLYDLIGWYDIAMHSVVGYVAALLGLFFVCILADVGRLRPAFVLLVCIAVSLAIAAVWEMYEFVTDLWLAGGAQGAPVETVTGDFVVPVNDTMEDILCNTGGALVFAIHYLAHVWSKKDLGIGFFKRDFTTKKRAAPLAAPQKEQQECPSCNTNAPDAGKNSKNS